MLTGVYTADPNKVKSAKKLSAISYEEMSEISNEGARVLHNRCIEIAERYKIPIITKSTFNNKPGTVISDIIEDNTIKSIVKKDVSRISVVGYGMSSKDEILGKIIEIANQNNLEIFNIDISRTKISIVFKEIVKDEILDEFHKICTGS